VIECECECAGVSIDTLLMHVCERDGLCVMRLCDACVYRHFKHHHTPTYGTHTRSNTLSLSLSAPYSHHSMLGIRWNLFDGGVLQEDILNIRKWDVFALLDEMAVKGTNYKYR
jgi:hypothetical protein